MSRQFYFNEGSIKHLSYSGQTEIGLREEFLKTLNGCFPEVAKAQTGVLRIMRRDANGLLLPCACRGEETYEPEVDHPCPLCLASGSYWDEVFVDMYRYEPGYDTSLAMKEMNIIPGNLAVPVKVFYVDYKTELTKEDNVIELVLDAEGVPVEPYRRRAIYRIGTVFDYRSDKGRIEYWKVAAYEDKNLPLYIA